MKKLILGLLAVCATALCLAMPASALTTVERVGVQISPASWDMGLKVCDTVTYACSVHLPGVAVAGSERAAAQFAADLTGQPVRSIRQPGGGRLDANGNGMIDADEGDGGGDW